MNCCQSPQCRGIEEVFNREIAQRELDAYRRKGSAKQTRWLVDAILSAGLEEFSLLDVGGGVGAIQHQLASQGARAIVNVDASPAYSNAARQEAARQGYADRASYHVGDFVQLAETLPPADVVTLDRVICCYDNMPALVKAASQRAGRNLGVVYPRETWYFRLAVGIINLIQRALRKPFRIFAHSSEAVESLVRSAGFERRFFRQGLIWQVVVYGR
jgi:magnesium-protoporphyrin O-methyltransferase